MSEEKKGLAFETITEQEALAVSISMLSDKPNSKSRYGDGGMSAQELKDRFDALPNLVREKFNAIAVALASDNAAKYITLDGSIGGIDNLYDFLRLFVYDEAGGTDEGIEKYIKVTYNDIFARQESRMGLQDVIDKISDWIYRAHDHLELYDYVVFTEDEFEALLYPLFQNEDAISDKEAATQYLNKTALMGYPDPDFQHKRIFVRGVTFTRRHGYSDLRMNIFQPSIKYIKFENCRWETEWRVSGKAPTDLAPTGTEYMRAPGDLDLVIDGIDVSADNVQAAKDAGAYWYIGLRNIKALVNSTVRYPEGYDIGNGWGFKLTCQYFDYASNNRVPALYDGANVSDCYIIEKLVRCTNCVNVVAVPVLKDAVENTVLVHKCQKLSNFKGNFTFEGEESAEVKMERLEMYDLVVSTVDELKALERNTAAKSVFVKDIKVVRTDRVNGFFDASEPAYYSKFVIPKNVKHIKFSKTFAHTCARVIIQGHEDCIIDGFPTVKAPFNYTNSVVLYNFKEARNCQCTNLHSYDSDGNYVRNDRVNGISNITHNNPTIIDYPSLAPANADQNTKFVNCDLMLVDGASVVEGCRAHSSIHGARTASIKNATIVNGLTVSYVYGAQLVFENCAHIYAVDTGNCGVSYINCPDIGASKSYVDKAVASASILGSNGKVPDKYLPPYAPLENGKVPGAYLPSYIDDVLEGFFNQNDGFFYYSYDGDEYFMVAGGGEPGKIYVDKATNKTYRWSGSRFVEISASLALGYTSSTAFPGDLGDAAHKHSQITKGNPHGTTLADILPVTAADNGKILQVVGGAWGAVTIPTAEGGSF